MTTVRAQPFLSASTRRAPRAANGRNEKGAKEERSAMPPPRVRPLRGPHDVSRAGAVRDYKARRRARTSALRPRSAPLGTARRVPLPRVSLRRVSPPPVSPSVASPLRRVSPPPRLPSVASRASCRLSERTPRRGRLPVSRPLRARSVGLSASERAGSSSTLLPGGRRDQQAENFGGSAPAGGGERGRPGLHTRRDGLSARSRELDGGRGRREPERGSRRRGGGGSG